MSQCFTTAPYSESLHKPATTAHTVTRWRLRGSQTLPAPREAARFWRRRQQTTPAAPAAPKTATDTPTPMPALAPEDKPEAAAKLTTTARSETSWCSEQWHGFGMERSAKTKGDQSVQSVRQCTGHRESGSVLREVCNTWASRRRPRRLGTVGAQGRIRR